MASMVYVEPAGVAGEALDDWTHAAVAHADQLPPKAKKQPPKAKLAGRTSRSGGTR